MNNDAMRQVLAAKHAIDKALAHIDRSLGGWNGDGERVYAHIATHELNNLADLLQEALYYQHASKPFRMTVGELLSILTEDAKRYVEIAPASIGRNEHMHRYRGPEPDQELVAAIVVDFINFVGAQRAVDYALYTKDIR